MAAFLNNCGFLPVSSGTADPVYSSTILSYDSPALAGAVNGETYCLRMQSPDRSQRQLVEAVYNSSIGTFVLSNVISNSSGTGTGPGQSGAGTKISFSTIPEVVVVEFASHLPSLSKDNVFLGFIQAVSLRIWNALPILGLYSAAGTIWARLFHDGTDTYWENVLNGVAFIKLNGNVWHQFSQGFLKIFASTSGSLNLVPAAASGSSSITFPAGTTDFSVTGGTGRVVKQTSSGGALTVAQLAASELSNGVQGSGAIALAVAPTLTTPAFISADLGTPNSGTLTNCTGTAAGLTAGSVTTNANLTGAVTSSGNATSLGSFTAAQLLAAVATKTGTGVPVFGTAPALSAPTGIVKGDVGLGNVDNTADTAKPVSTAQQTALNLKANLAGGTPFTGDVSSTGYIRSTGTSFGIGYGTGAGATATQITSKATALTLNRPTGQITMNAAALAAATIVSFVLTNSAIAATDVLVLNHISGGTVGAYTLNAQCAAGSATINIRNNTGGSLSDAIVIQFALIKGVNA